MAVSGQIYSMSFQNVTISAVQDLFYLKTSANVPLAVTSINLGQVTGTAVANCKLRIRYLPATATAGSGGSAGTLNKWNAGGAAATATGRTNDTSQATSSGTIVDLWGDAWNILNGYLWVPPITSRPFIIPVSAAIVVSLDTAPSSVVTDGTITWEELA